MRTSACLTACVLGLCAGFASSASAATQTASSGNVTATFTFSGVYPNFANERLTITQAGQVFYDEPVTANPCGAHCAPGSTSAKEPSVQLLDLEHDGQPDVLLDLFSGGAHCCSITEIFSYDPGTMTYARTQRDFGDPGDQTVDLDHNGRYEFLTADDSFAYEFTDFAASGLPIEVLTFTDRRFHNVTRNYPQLIAKDAAGWLKAFKSMAKQHYDDSVGLIAAWAADEDLLGHSKLVTRYLTQQARAGHLNTPLGPTEAGGRKFIANLQRFLRRHGYLS
jgi:hypothetical protein